MSGGGRARGEAGMLPRTILIVLLALLFLYLVQSILLPFVLAGMIAYVLGPALDRASARTGLPRPLFAGAALLAAMGLAAFVGTIGVSSLVAQLDRVGADPQGTLNALFERIFGARSVIVLGQQIDPAGILQAARQWLHQPDRVAEITRWSVVGLADFVLLWVALGYFLFDGARIGRGFFWLVPPPWRPYAHQAWARLDPVLRRYLIGVACVVGYATAASWLGLGLFLGLSHAFALALVTGFLEVIPAIGPAAAALIAGLVAVGEAKSAGGIIAYALYAVALRLSIDQLVGPIVLGRSARLPPVLVIFCFLTGGILFGVAGVILSVPVALAIRTLLAGRYDASRPQAADGSR